jgi:hypothetical protein
MPKKIKIKESQMRMLVEAMQDGFRLDALRHMPFKEKIEYCEKMLGDAIGSGSSRLVFQIDDETVLKLAKNGKGLAQNEVECRLGKIAETCDYFPKVHNGTDFDGYKWIISDFVLPADYVDFENVAQLPFRDLCAFVYLVNSAKVSPLCKSHLKDMYIKYRDIPNAIKIFKMIEDLDENYDFGIGDLLNPVNWGIRLKNGQTEMVVLDGGLTNEVYNKHYKK